MLEDVNGADLVRQAREAAGLSRSALANKAGVPTSTVSRIENGSSSPTLIMLSKLIAAAGHRLTIGIDPQLARPSSVTIETLVDAHLPRTAARQINWARLRGFIDYLSANKDLVAEAIDTPPTRTGDDTFDALLAGIAEKLADDAGIPRPRWTRSVPPASTPWEPPGTPARIKQARAHAPEQLAARNIWLAERDLWREAA